VKHDLHQQDNPRLPLITGLARTLVAAFLGSVRDNRNVYVQATNLAASVIDVKGAVLERFSILRKRCCTSGATHGSIAAADMLQELDATAQALALLDDSMDKLGIVPPLQHRAIDLEMAHGEIANAIACPAILRLPAQNSTGCASCRRR
jgi:hypothetical protein